MITVGELEAMTPAERDAAFESSIVYDLDQVPATHRPALDEQRRRILEREARPRGPRS